VVLIIFQFLLVWKHARRKPERERVICVCVCVSLILYDSHHSFPLKQGTWTLVVVVILLQFLLVWKYARRKPKTRARHLCVCVYLSYYTTHTTIMFSFETGHVDTRRGGNLVAVPPGLETRALQAQARARCFQFFL